MQFSRALAAAVNTLLDDPALRQSMARKARARVEAHFSWTSIARQTADVLRRPDPVIPSRSVTAKRRRSLAGGMSDRRRAA